MLVVGSYDPLMDKDELKEGDTQKEDAKFFLR